MPRALALTVLLPALAALGNSRGAPSSLVIDETGCNRCHTHQPSKPAPATPTVTLTGPGTLTEGQFGRFVVKVSTANGPTAGFNLSAEGRGTFAPVSSPAGEQVAVLTEGGRTEATHQRPKDDAEDGASDGVVTFEVDWQAPAKGGPVRFTAWGNSVDGNGNQLGDRSAQATWTVEVRCTDGGTTLTCDCPFEPPGAESCNGVDDDCDGELDEEPGLCRSGETCVAGACRPEASPTDGGADVPPNPGCGCGAGAPATGALLVALAALTRRPPGRRR